MRKEYEKLLDQMYFEIGSTLIDNDMCRKGIGIPKVDEEEIIRSNRRTFMNLKIMMIRLERSLYGDMHEEQTLQEISSRDTSRSEITIDARPTTQHTVGYRGTD